MKKYIVIGNDSPFETKFDYEVGEIITVNSSTPAKCVSKDTIDGDIYYKFKLGKASYSFE